MPEIHVRVLRFTRSRQNTAPFFICYIWKGRKTAISKQVVAVCYTHSICICTDTDRHSYIRSMCVRCRIACGSQECHLAFMPYPYVFYSRHIRVRMFFHLKYRRRWQWWWGRRWRWTKTGNGNMRACFDFHPIDLCMVSLNTNVRWEVCAACEGYIYHFPHQVLRDKPHWMI